MLFGISESLRVFADTRRLVGTDYAQILGGVLSNISVLLRMPLYVGLTSLPGRNIPGTRKGGRVLSCDQFYPKTKPPF
jgi:hypothetical protein